MTVRADDPSEGEGVPDRMRVWGPAIAWAVVLFVLSSRSGLGAPLSFPGMDKLAHMVLYAVLGAALAWGRTRSPTPVAHGVLLGVGALYGVSDEWHQLYVPGRTPDPADWIADIVGLSAGYVLTVRLLGREESREQSGEDV